MNIENKVKVTICGKEYSLRTDETPEYIKNLAVRTEKEINDLVKLKPGFGIQNAAVFVALTSLDEAAKSSAAVENIRSQIKAYMNEAAKARSSKEKLSVKVRELEEKIKALENENKELKKRPPLYDCEQLVLENTITPAVTILAGENGSVNSKEAEISGEKAVQNSEETHGDKQSITETSSAVSGDGASCGEEKERQKEKGEMLPGSSAEENAEAQSDGGDTRPDNMNAASEHEDDRENKVNLSKNRKKKR